MIGSDIAMRPQYIEAERTYSTLGHVSVSLVRMERFSLDEPINAAARSPENEGLSETTTRTPRAAGWPPFPLPETLPCFRLRDQAQSCRLFGEAPLLVRYTRMSTRDQFPALQIEALRQAGCEKVFTKKASGAQRDRDELKAALDYIRAGDTLAVWKLDRLARSVRQLVETAEDLAHV